MAKYWFENAGGEASPISKEGFIATFIWLTAVVVADWIDKLFKLNGIFFGICAIVFSSCFVYLVNKRMKPFQKRK